MNVAVYWPHSHHLILHNYRGTKNINVKDADTNRGDAFQLRHLCPLQGLQIRKRWASDGLQNTMIWSPWNETRFMATKKSWITRCCGCLIALVSVSHSAVVEHCLLVDTGWMLWLRWGGCWWPASEITIVCGIRSAWLGYSILAVLPLN